MTTPVFNPLRSPTYRARLQAVAEALPPLSAAVLVTGATGLLGSCLVDVLRAANRLPDRHLRVLALSRSRERLQARFPRAAEDPNLILLPQDVTEPLRTEEPIDFILHLASNADPAAYAAFPAETLLTNILGARNMLEYCRAHTATKLLLASTFEVYGRLEGKTVYKEEDVGLLDFNALRAAYPESKRTAENLLRCYVREYGVSGVIARLASIYGPTMLPDDSKAHAQFLRAGLAGEDIVLKSPGLQRRTYCYLFDAVSALLCVLLHGATGEAYNIANENAVATIVSLAREVARQCGTRVTGVEPTEAERQRYSAPQDCVLDNGKLKALGWQGSFPLPEGIRDTLQILREAT